MYREAAFAVLNQETGPEIQSVYMTVAADLVLNQVRLVTSSTKYPSIITITKSLGFRRRKRKGIKLSVVTINPFRAVG